MDDDEASSLLLSFASSTLDTTVREKLVPPESQGSNSMSLCPESQGSLPTPTPMSICSNSQGGVGYPSQMSLCVNDHLRLPSFQEAAPRGSEGVPNRATRSPGMSAGLLLSAVQVPESPTSSFEMNVEYSSFQRKVVQRSLFLGVPLPSERRSDRPKARESQYAARNTTDSNQPPLNLQQTNSTPCSFASTQLLEDFAPESQLSTEVPSTQFSVLLVPDSQEQDMIVDQNPEAGDNSQGSTDLTQVDLMDYTPRETQESEMLIDAPISFSETIASFPLPPTQPSRPTRSPTVPPRPATRSKVREIREHLAKFQAEQAAQAGAMIGNSRSYLITPIKSGEDMNPQYTPTKPRAGRIPKAARQSFVARSQAASRTAKSTPILVEESRGSQDGQSGEDNPKPGKQKVLAKGNLNAFDEWRNLVEPIDKPWSLYEYNEDPSQARVASQSPHPGIENDSGRNAQTTSRPTFYSSISAPEARNFNHLDSHRGYAAPAADSDDYESLHQVYYGGPAETPNLRTVGVQLHREERLRENNENMIQILSQHCRTKIDLYSAERLLEKSPNGATPASHGNSQHLPYRKATAFEFVMEMRTAVENVRMMCAEQMELLRRLETEILVKEASFGAWGHEKTSVKRTLGEREGSAVESDATVHGRSDSGDGSKSNDRRVKARKFKASTGNYDTAAVEVKREDLSLEPNDGAESREWYD